MEHNLWDGFQIYISCIWKRHDNHELNPKCFADRFSLRKEKKTNNQIEIWFYLFGVSGLIASVVFSRQSVCACERNFFSFAAVVYTKMMCACMLHALWIIFNITNKILLNFVVYSLNLKVTHTKRETGTRHTSVYKKNVRKHARRIKFNRMLSTVTPKTFIHDALISKKSLQLANKNITNSINIDWNHTEWRKTFSFLVSKKTFPNEAQRDESCWIAFTTSNQNSWRNVFGMRPCDTAV